MKKINRIRKISKDRSKAKKDLKELQKTKIASDNEQTVDIINDTMVRLNVMKTKLGVDLLSEFVSKPIAEKILSKSVREIKAYNRMVESRVRRQRENIGESTVESNNKGSGKGSGVGTPQKDKVKKKRGSSSGSDNKLVMA